MVNSPSSMVSIYVHIPFCLKKCDYCDFFSVPCARADVPHEAYLRALVAQLERDAVRFAGRTVGSIYCGGGTPSLVPAAFFVTLREAIAERFALSGDLEFSCEVNPATADAAWFRDMRTAGVTRASIGVQSFQPEPLALLGRAHTADDAMRAIAEAQEAGFQSVSCDLIFAIPGETMAQLEDDLRIAMTFQPEHLSAYGLTIEEGTPFAARYACGARNAECGMTEAEQLKQFRVVGRMLPRSGWPRYEISNFAKPGFECRHNLNYWRYGSYLGLGAGATSFCFSGHGSRVTDHEFARRWTQIRDIDSYIAGSTKLAESEDIDQRTAMGEFCFLGLRTTEGIAPSDFEQRFGVPFDERYGRAVRHLIDEGLLERADDRVRITPRGLELSNQVFTRFIA